MGFFKRKPKPAKPAPIVAPTATTRRAPVSPEEETIVKLRTAMTAQQKRETHLDKKIALIIKEAKEKKEKGDIKGALYSMKRKKLCDQELEKIQNVKMTLETQIFHLESSALNMGTFSAMKESVNTFQKIRTDCGVEQTEDVMEAIREEVDRAREVDDVLRQSIDMVDDDELLAELSALEEMEVAKPKVKATTGLQMPKVPETELPSIEDEAIKRLEAQLAAI